jgi:hypothetical protein
MLTDSSMRIDSETSIETDCTIARYLQIISASRVAVGDRGDRGAVVRSSMRECGQSLCDCLLTLRPPTFLAAIILDA